MDENNSLKGKDQISKSNMLGSLKCDKMSMMDYRLLCAYLSKINPKDSKTKEISFSLESFQELLGVEINLSRLKKITWDLLGKRALLPTEKGWIAFTLFEYCKIDVDSNGKTSIFISCTDTSKDLFFNIVDKGYFKYRLQEIKGMRSIYCFRFYEFLRMHQFQWRTQNNRLVISLVQLREELGLPEDKFSDWRKFKVKVLDLCQKDFDENPNRKLTFTYDCVREGLGGKITGLIIMVSQKDDVSSNKESSSLPKEYLSACNHEFTEKELQNILKLIKNKFTELDVVSEKEYISQIAAYLESMYLMMDGREIQADRRFAYYFTMIRNDIQKSGAEGQNTSSKKTKNRFSNFPERSYDMDEFEKKLLQV